MNIDFISVIHAILKTLQLCHRLHRAPEELKNFVEILNNTATLLDTVRPSFDTLAAEVQNRQSIEDMIKRAEVALVEAMRVAEKSGGKTKGSRRLWWVLNYKEAAETNKSVIQQVHATLEGINLRLGMVTERQAMVREIRALRNITLRLLNGNILLSEQGEFAYRCPGTRHNNTTPMMRYLAYHQNSTFLASSDLDHRQRSFMSSAMTSRITTDMDMDTQKVTATVGDWLLCNIVQDNARSREPAVASAMGLWG